MVAPLLLEEKMRKEYDRNTKLTIGTSPVIISTEKENNNQTRKSIWIVNKSTAGQIVTVSIGESAEDGAGIPLYPGGSYGDVESEGYTATQKQLFAISDVAGALISIQERGYLE